MSDALLREGDLTFPTENYLKPNGHGGYIISVSALNAWARCQMQKFYEDRARRDPEAPQGESLSITTYGSVMHVAMHAMERALSEGREDALALGLRTFEYYWQPENLDQLGLKITVWLRAQTWEGLLERGKLALRDSYELLRKDDSHVLALEYGFAVPLEINGRLHTLHGYIDRLSIKKHQRKPYLSIDDYKAGKKPAWLRYYQQFSAYSLATTKPEFWTGWDDAGLSGEHYRHGGLEHFDEEITERIETSFSNWGYRLHSGSASHGEQVLPLASRRGRWISLNEVGFSDAGWRTARDFARFELAIDAYVRAREAGIYSLNLSGDTCTFCAFRAICGGTGLPDDDEGAPA
jgi:hypothetical protein